ncbi:methyltransferase family protein [Nocardia sp. NPDC051570]|uniref:methyltransferase family protein n=1 Tax=Nocardia sp. NPDC051570 TaxID=3364324 RepID=UPI00378D59CA
MPVGATLDDMTVIDVLAAAALWSLQILALVWLLTAIWFAARWPAGPRGKIWHFLSTLLPEPWMILGIIVLSVATHLVPQTFWSHVTWTWSAFTAVGAVLVVASVALMIWARLALGDMWAGRPMLQQDHQLRTGGPYRLVRHPIYTGLLGVMVGLTLMSGFGATTLTLIFVLAWLLRRVRVEDRMLSIAFGDQYREFQNRVPALIPFLGRSNA